MIYRHGDKLARVSMALVVQRHPVIIVGIIINNTIIVIVASIDSNVKVDDILIIIIHNHFGSNHLGSVVGILLSHQV